MKKNIHCFVFLLLLFVLFQACKKENSATNQITAVNNSSIPSAGIILTSIRNGANSQLQVLDTAGNIIAVKNVAHDVWNFERWNFNGTTRFTYAELNDAVNNPFGGAAFPVWQIILDEKLNELKRVAVLSHDNITYDSPPTYDLHDFILLDDNHYIGLSYQIKTVNNIPSGLNPVANCKVIAPVIQEVQNGTVKWEWVGTNYPEFYSTSVEGNAYSDSTIIHDYMHINSIYIDPKDNNLICSFRNLNQVLKINRVTGDIIWRLGGNNSDFVLNGSMKFLRQHDATLTADGLSLLLVDNGEITERPYSRVLEFKLDEASMGITFFRALNLPGNAFIQYTGSAQKIRNTYFVGCGPLSRYMQINFVNNEMILNNTLPYQSYRVLRY